MSELSDAPRWHTLVFAPDDHEGRLLFPAALKGTIVRAGLGVSMIANALTEDLYADTQTTTMEADRSISYVTRQDVGHIIDASLAALGHQAFWTTLSYQAVPFGRLIMPWLWHALERPCLMAALLERWLARTIPTHLALWRVERAPPGVREVVTSIAEQHDIKLVTLDAPPMPQLPQTDRTLPHAPTGCFPYQTHVDAPDFEFQHGIVRGTEALIAHGVMTLKDGGPWHFPVRAAASGVYLVLRLAHVYTTGASLLVTLRYRGRAVLLRVTNAGWLEARSQNGEWQSTHQRVAGPDAPDIMVVCDGSRARLCRPTQQTVSLPVIDEPNRTDNGVIIDADGAQTVNLQIVKFAVGSIATADVVAGLQDIPEILRDKQHNIQCPIAAPNSAAKLGPVLVPMTARGTLIGYSPTLGHDSAPIYCEGLMTALQRHGIQAEPLAVGAPWTIAGRSVLTAGRETLYGRGSQANQVAAQAEITQAYKAAAQEFKTQLETASPIRYRGASFNVIVADALMRLLPTVASMYGVYREFCSVFADRRPSAVFGPRLDAAFQTAVLAAKSLEIPTVSLEISFQFFEANRWHRRSGEPETIDHLCYWGDLALNRLEQLGLDAANQAATGLHLIDRYRAAQSDRLPIGKRRTDYWDALGIGNVTGPVVLFASHYGAAEPMVDIDFWTSTIGTVLDTLDRAGQGTLIVKCLEVDHAGVLQGLAQSMRATRLRLLPPAQPFQNLNYLLGSDLVLCIPSTILGEAAALGIPGRTLLLHNVLNWYPVSDSQSAAMTAFAPAIETTADLTEAINDLVSGRLPPTLATDHARLGFAALFGSLDGHNLERALGALASRHQRKST